MSSNMFFDPKLIYEPKCRLHPDAEVETNYTTGDAACVECGLVVRSRIIDEGPEWRNFDGRDHSRCGPPDYLLRDSNELTTYIKFPKGGPKYNIDNYYGGFKKIQSSNPRMDSRLQSAYNEIRGIAGRMHIPTSVSDYAMLLYKQLRKVPHTGGRFLDSTAAAVMFIACRYKNVPRPLREFSTNSMATYKEVAAAYRRIADLFEFDSSKELTAASYVPRYCTLLDLPFRVRKLAQHIALGVRKHSLMDGRSPVSVAAGSIKLATETLGEYCTITKIAKAVGCSTRAGRDCYKLLIQHRRQLLGSYKYPTGCNPLLGKDEAGGGSDCDNEMDACRSALLGIGGAPAGSNVNTPSATVVSPFAHGFCDIEDVDVALSASKFMASRDSKENYDSPVVSKSKKDNIVDKPYEGEEDMGDMGDDGIKLVANPKPKDNMYELVDQPENGEICMSDVSDTIFDDSEYKFISNHHDISEAGDSSDDD